MPYNWPNTLGAFKNKLCIQCNRLGRAHAVSKSPHVQCSHGIAQRSEHGSYSSQVSTVINEWNVWYERNDFISKNLSRTMKNFPKIESMLEKKLANKVIPRMMIIDYSTHTQNG